MKKMAILIIALMVVNIGFLSGCLENEANTEKNKFIGIWVETVAQPVEGEDNLYVYGVWRFYNNDSCILISHFFYEDYNNYTNFTDALWFDYKIEEGILYIEGYSIMLDAIVKSWYEYDFSDRNNILTLSNDNEHLILGRSIE